jgi:hypothetical protein
MVDVSRPNSSTSWSAETHTVSVSVRMLSETLPSAEL